MSLPTQRFSSDAAGFGAIVTLRNDLRRRRAALTTQGAAPRLARPFILGGLEQLLDAQRCPSSSPVGVNPIGDGSAPTTTGHRTDS